MDDPPPPNAVPSDDLRDLLADWVAEANIDADTATATRSDDDDT